MHTNQHPPKFFPFHNGWLGYSDTNPNPSQHCPSQAHHWQHLYLLLVSLDHLPYYLTGIKLFFYTLLLEGLHFRPKKKHTWLPPEIMDIFYDY